MWQGHVFKDDDKRSRDHGTTTDALDYLPTGITSCRRVEMSSPLERDCRHNSHHTPPWLTTPSRVVENISVGNGGRNTTTKYPCRSRALFPFKLDHRKRAHNRARSWEPQRRGAANNSKVRRREQRHLSPRGQGWFNKWPRATPN